MMLLLQTVNLVSAGPDSVENASRQWVLKQYGKNEYLMISLTDTLVDSLDCLHYREKYSASPLGGSDVVFRKDTGDPLWFMIPALGEEVIVDYQAKQYIVHKRMKEKSYTMYTPFDTCAFPSYARFVRLLSHQPPDSIPVNLYLYNGKTVPYRFEKSEKDTLILRNTKIPCRVWHITMEASRILGQEDWVWIRENPPCEIMKVKSVTRVGRIFGISLGKSTAVFERVY